MHSIRTRPRLIPEEVQAGFIIHFLLSLAIKRLPDSADELRLGIPPGSFPCHSLVGKHALLDAASCVCEADFVS